MTRPTLWLCFSLILVAGSFAVAQSTNAPTATNALAATESVPHPTELAPASASSPRGFDDSAFRIVAERNIFNANRSGGQVRLSSSRRPARVESFTLVGTMAYEKGAFAFFDGTSSDFTKVLKTDGVIAGHKLVDILAAAVKLEADGKILELPIGSAMRREDEGTWHEGEGIANSDGSSSNRDSDTADHSSRSDRANATESQNRITATSSNSSAGESDILKRLMERREKESQ